MGSSGSRLGGSSPPPSRPRHGHHRTRFKRALSSIFICGAFPSSEPAHEVEDDPAEKLVNSAVNNDMEKIQIPAKNSSSPTGAGSEFSNRTTETVVGQERNMLPGVNSSREYTRGHVDATDKGKSLSMNKDLYFTRSFLNSRSNDASTSYEDEQSHQPESSNASANTDAPNRGKSIRNGDAPQSCAGFMLSNCPSSDGGESLSDEVSVENCANEVMVFHDCDSGSVSVLSESPLDDTSQQTYPSGLGFLVTERDRGHPDGNVLQVDVVSVSSDVSSSSFSELSNHEARRNSRRLFWDAFSRRSSRRSAESRSLLFTTDDPDGLESHDRWLLDFNGDFFDEGIGVDFRSYASSSQNTSERHWHSSSEIQERFHDVGRNGTDHRVATCPAGIHPDGACSCNSMLRAEESGARASISRIVMLAEALFEVLDDIHRQPMSLSLSMVSLPAPESIVDSFPVKDHRRPERLESGDDVAQCYICLAEYEEGDKIRILPCRHEFHVMCIDKWLKEIHGVCPLCRGDVREGFSSTEDTVSRSEVPSL